MIHQTQASGTTKKEAEVNAATEMIPFVTAMLESGGQLIPVRDQQLLHFWLVCPMHSVHHEACIFGKVVRLSIVGMAWTHPYMYICI